MYQVAVKTEYFEPSKVEKSQILKKSSLGKRWGKEDAEKLVKYALEELKKGVVVVIIG